MNNLNQETKKTYRRYEDGETPEDWDLEEKIFTQDKSYKCPTYINKTPPCQGSCPSGHEIRGWLAIARGMDKPPVEGMAWQEYAFERMAQANPFPATMGRVCPAPCEEGCNRNEVDDYVGINAVEQYVGDWANENNLKHGGIGADTGYKIAIVGGGPAGLSAAFFLRKIGHAVVLFEANDTLGGMMYYGIPGYRTPRGMLEKEIGRITEMGVQIHLNTKVGKDISVKQLEDDYDAIFWALGAQNGRPLPVPGWQGTKNCINGIEFLDAFNKGYMVDTKLRVVVVGGGDTSIDVASVARRLGHVSSNAKSDGAEKSKIDFTAGDAASALNREGVSATLTSLFPLEQMTASEHERADAKREGVDIKGGVMPLEVIKDDNGMAIALKMCECDMKGMTPIPREGTDFTIECDIIISAIGQYGDFDGIEELDAGKGFIATDFAYQVKGKKKHFAGGDIIKPHLLTTAIGHGRIAAQTITDFLDDGEIEKRPKIDAPSFNLLQELAQRGHPKDKYNHQPTRGTDKSNFAVHNYDDRSDNQIIKHKDLFLAHFPYVAREKRDEVKIEADNVLGNFEERIIAYSEEQAQKEGERCMSCGMCFECDNCVIYCPQDAVARVKKSDRAVGRYVFTDYSKCIGCHICADVCPTGYINMGLGG